MSPARGVFFPWDREKAELFLVFLMVPAVFLNSALQTPVVTADQTGYYHDWYYSPGSFVASVLQSLGMGCLTVFLVGSFSPELARSWESGLRAEPGRQLACAGLMLVIFTFCHMALSSAATLLSAASFPYMDWMAPANLQERLQALAIALINGPAEEFLRFYLIARIASLTKSG
ncbi:MAG: hypothetical protein AAB576_04890, partial [Elusimicrobiota bacterium]